MYGSFAVYISFNYHKYCELRDSAKGFHEWQVETNPMS